MAIGRTHSFGSGAKEIGRIGLERSFLFFLLGKSLDKVLNETDIWSILFIR